MEIVEREPIEVEASQRQFSQDIQMGSVGLRNAHVLDQGDLLEDVAPGMALVGSTVDHC